MAHPIQKRRVINTLRQIGTCISIVSNCLFAGSIFTFPLWSPNLGTSLNLTGAEVSAVAFSAVFGQYATSSYWGNFADKQGPHRTSLWAGTLFATGYALMTIYLYQTPLPHDRHTLDWIFLAVPYALVGSATAASYFSAIVCANATFGSYPGLAIGVPCAIFGLSPLFLSQIATACFKKEGELNYKAYLATMALVLGLVNFGGYFGLRIKPKPTQKSSMAVGEGDALLPKSPPPKPLTIREFVTDSNFLIFGIVVLFGTGPSEMIMASLGSISQSLIPASRQSTALEVRHHQVALLSICNTVSRLLAGGLSDWISKRFRERLFLLLGTCVFLCVAWFYSAFFITSTSNLWVLSAGTGMGYGFFFTLSPSIVSSVWGMESFGRNWGLVSYWSAIGAFFYTLAYGFISDQVKGGGESPFCEGPECFRTSLVLSALGALAAGSATLILSRPSVWGS